MKNNTSYSSSYPATIAGSTGKMKNNHCTGVLEMWQDDATVCSTHAKQYPLNKIA